MCEKCKKRCCHGGTQKRHGKKVGWIKCIFLLNGSTLLDNTASGIHKEYMDYVECVFEPILIFLINVFLILVAPRRDTKQCHGGTYLSLKSVVSSKTHIV